MIELIQEIIMTLVVTLYYWTVAIVTKFIPARFRSKDVSGENVLITGAGSGLGRLMAYRFAALGANLILWDIQDKANRDTADTCKKLHGTKVHTYVCDLSNRDNIYETAAKVKKEVGNVDILVNNAGIVTGKKFLECPDNLIQKTMEVNTMAHFWTVKSFLPSMMSRNHGHIVNIASAAGLTGVTGLADYCASKFGAVGFDESLRYELAAQGKDGVNTTVVCPYYINTGMFEGVKTRFPLIMPIVEPEFAVDCMMDAILTNQHMVYIPKVLNFFMALKGILPTKCAYIIGDFFGVNNTMDEFKGRPKLE